MVDPRQRELAETVFERNQRREKEINNALKQEYARREAAVKNMCRLRALRLARDAKREVAVIRSVEFIVQSAAKDAVGEMAVRGDLPPGRSSPLEC